MASASRTANQRTANSEQCIWCAGLSCLSRSSNQINQKNQTDEMNQRDQMNQLPATRPKMGPSICSFFRFSGFETDAAGSRCEWFHELADGFEERVDMVIVRFDPPL